LLEKRGGRSFVELNHGIAAVAEEDNDKNHQGGNESLGITPASRLSHLSPPWTAEYWVWRPTIEQDAAQKVPVRFLVIRIFYLLSLPSGSFLFVGSA
jgi:hypothetical protein